MKPLKVQTFAWVFIVCFARLAIATDSEPFFALKGETGTIIMLGRRLQSPGSSVDSDEAAYKIDFRQYLKPGAQPFNDWRSVRDSVSETIVSYSAESVDEVDRFVTSLNLLNRQEYMEVMAGGLEDAGEVEAAAAVIEDALEGGEAAVSAFGQFVKLIRSYLIEALDSIPGGPLMKTVEIFATIGIALLLGGECSSTNGDCGNCRATYSVVNSFDKSLKYGGPIMQYKDNTCKWGRICAQSYSAFSAGHSTAIKYGNILHKFCPQNL